jgi:hypothetical protein
MVICKICTNEMKCIKTGVKVRYNESGNHVYSGDEFGCPTCDNRSIVISSSSYRDGDVENTVEPTDIWMDR